MAKKSKFSLLIFIICFFLISILFIYENINKNSNISKEEFNCIDCNVIIIGMTNVVKTHMSTYDYQRQTTPNIDKFANKSIVFENAFSHASWTLPSFTSIVTSQYPFEHKVMMRDSTRNKYSKLDPNIITIMDVLKENNYTTIGFTGGFDLSEKYGVVTRFDELYYQEKELNPYLYSDPFFEQNQMTNNIRKYGSFNYSTKKSIEWVENNKNKKFFMYIQGFDAHCPFEYPQKNDIFVEKEINITFNECYWTFDRTEKIKIGDKYYYSVYTDSTNESIKPKLISEEELEYMISLYDGEINLVDNYLGDLFEYLEKENLLNNTIIIITSEHGDVFGKSGRIMRGGPIKGTFYDDVINVPLIIYHPNIKLNSTLKRDELVELIDISPTILDVLNIEKPTQFKGNSIRPIISDNTKIKSEIYSGSLFIPSNTNYFYNDSTYIEVIRNKEWKLTHEITLSNEINNGSNYIKYNYSQMKENPQKEYFEFYNIQNDPNENENLFQKHEDKKYKTIFENLNQSMYNWSLNFK